MLLWMFCFCTLCVYNYFITGDAELPLCLSYIRRAPASPRPPVPSEPTYWKHVYPEDMKPRCVPLTWPGTPWGGTRVPLHSGGLLKVENAPPPSSRSLPARVMWERNELRVGENIEHVRDRIQWRRAMRATSAYVTAFGICRGYRMCPHPTALCPQMPCRVDYDGVRKNYGALVQRPPKRGPRLHGGSLIFLLWGRGVGAIMRQNCFDNKALLYNLRSISICFTKLLDRRLFLWVEGLGLWREPRNESQGISASERAFRAGARTDVRMRGAPVLLRNWKK